MSFPIFVNPAPLMPALIILDTVCLLALAIMSIQLMFRDYPAAPFYIKLPIGLVIVACFGLIADRLGGLEKHSYPVPHVFLWRTILDIGLASLAIYRIFNTRSEAVLKYPKRKVRPATTKAAHDRPGRRPAI